MNEKFKAVLCYSGVISFFFIKSRNDFIKFHAKQGMAVLLCAFLVTFIPLLGWAIGRPLLGVSSIVAANRALSGQKWKIPIVYFFTRFIK